MNTVSSDDEPQPFFLLYARWISSSALSPFHPQLRKSAGREGGNIWSIYTDTKQTVQCGHVHSVSALYPLYARSLQLSASATLADSTFIRRHHQKKSPAGACGPWARAGPYAVALSAYMVVSPVYWSKYFSANFLLLLLTFSHNYLYFLLLTF